MNYYILEMQKHPQISSIRVLLMRDGLSTKETLLLATMIKAMYENGSIVSFVSDLFEDNAIQLSAKSDFVNMVCCCLLFEDSEKSILTITNLFNFSTIADRAIEIIIHKRYSLLLPLLNNEDMMIRKRMAVIFRKSILDNTVEIPEDFVFIHDDIRMILKTELSLLDQEFGRGPAM